MSPKPGYVVAVLENGKAAETWVVIDTDDPSKALQAAMQYVENQAYKCTRINSCQFQADPTSQSSAYAERMIFIVLSIQII